MSLQSKIQQRAAHVYPTRSIHELEVLARTVAAGFIERPDGTLGLSPNPRAVGAVRSLAPELVHAVGMAGTESLSPMERSLRQLHSLGLGADALTTGTVTNADDLDRQLLASIDRDPEAA